MSSISVIISTYNQPNQLDLVLAGYVCQKFSGFELIIADDGSDKRTLDVIKAFRKNHDLPITHVWQEDDGFQKTKILNKAILKAKSDYLIFTDGDCIPRDDFVATHFSLKKPNCALSGGYFKLNKKVSSCIDKSLIYSQECFEKNWLISQGQEKSFKMTKLSRSAGYAKTLNMVTTTKATFDGMNVSCWLKDILAVNGFDERMAYGGEDREVGERMVNNSIKFIQIRYSAICLHLYHDRPYKNDSFIKQNQAIRSLTRKNKIIQTPFGIVKG
ncbi:glycosyltransferase family 2 protein [Winogradskyella sp. DF17]|uniref:Glycosyltransferase family 2 protein n=1 Tax=Winogradskyella pelagia TaxID=2819984 RepID=A0ABS3T0C0_9FLAO|nr:glycosyltransferase family 2 protein [Winogradskyella sp. DF17]MBO3116189.1 glycosyltransferase family 2 protein [Winogradskyella sp. DF17]